MTLIKSTTISRFLLLITLSIVLLVTISCPSPEIVDLTTNINNVQSYHLYFYYDNEIIVDKTVDVGCLVGNVEIPDIDTEQYSVKWYTNSSFIGNYYDLSHYILPSQPNTSFYAQVKSNYYNVTIDKNNGEIPIFKKFSSSIFNETSPEFPNYQVVPGRFVNLVFDGWNIDGVKITSNNYSQFLKNDCVVYAGWKLPAVAGSSSWESISIRIPEFITTLGNSVFENWKELKEVVFEEDSKLKSIGSAAFASTNKLTSISIPDSVIEIGDFAFKESSINICMISSSSELKTIGKQAFFKTKIESINLPNNLTTIMEEAFCVCLSMTTIIIDDVNSKLTTIGKYAFSDTAISSFIIPRLVSRIDGGAFSSCDVLTGIYVNSSNHNFTSLDGILCKNNTLVAWPDGKIPAIIPEGISEIKDFSFGFSFIDSVQLPTTLLKIGISAFEESTVASISLPDSVIEIGNNAFYFSALQHCITSANSNLSRIGSRAFYGTKLSEFNMPQNITLVGTEAFQNRYLSKIGFYEGIKTIGDYFNTVYTDSIIIPNSVTAIVSNAFLQNSTLFTNKSSLDELSEYGLSDNQIARYIWVNKTTNVVLK